MGTLDLVTLEKIDQVQEVQLLGELGGRVQASIGKQKGLRSENGGP